MADLLKLYDIDEKNIPSGKELINKYFPDYPSKNPELYGFVSYTMINDNLRPHGDVYTSKGIFNFGSRKEEYLFYQGYLDNSFLPHGKGMMEVEGNTMECFFIHGMPNDSNVKIRHNDGNVKSACFINQVKIY